VAVVACVALGSAQASKTFIPYADAAQIIGSLREDLIPADLRNKTPTQREAMWPAWISARDAAVRARVEAGDEDSVVYLLLFGTTFTAHARATDPQLAELTRQPAAELAWLRLRLDDFIRALEMPGTHERLQFARQVLMRRGIDPATADGRTAARRYLEEHAATMVGGGAVRSSTLLDRAAGTADKTTLFRERGLSSDTSIFIDYGIDSALAQLKLQGRLDTGTVRRVAIVGPGLDFTDKLEGYDFYPQQSIQPFALVDSLMRHDLAAPGLQVTAFDLSPRVIRHLDKARERAKAGEAYTLVLPRNLDRPWTPGLVDYWQRIAGWIGEEAPAPTPPANAGRLQVRSVRVRPAVTQAVVARDLNIVLERTDAASPADRYDLVIATNILLYYDVFEQALAAANIARLLRPGGLLLTNNQIFELPPVPLGGVGFTDVTYMALPGIGDTGDRIVWYQRQ
jgi:hypothetical protein